MPRKIVNIGKVLVESLTQEQVATLLTVVSSSSDLNLYMEKFEETDPDMASTVKRILAHGSDSKGKHKTQSVVSLKRTMEYWGSLWQRFYDVISEVGDEEGIYTVSDHHWEPPYFDGSSLADDLEPIAEKMLIIMDEVHETVDDPDLFHHALGEIDDKIQSYPEWMGAEHGEPCILKEKMTQCVLKWLWLGAGNKSDGAQTFAENALELEDAYNIVQLDPEAFARFFLDLPDSDCRAIYEFLRKGDQRADLDNTYSVWHHIKHMYEARFDSDKYIESCKKHLPHNWRYGLPLVEDAIVHRNYELAESQLTETFSSYLGGHRKRNWFPENSLLLSERRNFLSEGEEEIGKLLKNWADVAKQLKNTGRHSAAQFQAVTFDGSGEWDVILRTYQRLSKGAAQKRLAPLFDQWKNEMASRSYPYFLDSPKVTDTWIHWLIEAMLDEKKGGETFLTRVAEWLSDLEKDSKAFRQQWLWLAVFTRDLPNNEKVKTPYPSFWETVVSESDYEGYLAVSRRKGLRRMKAGSWLATVLEVWKKRLKDIVPDPARVRHSRYTECARWAEALFELNKDGYHALMVQWRKKHHRRRNLWRDLKAMNLPVD